MSSEKYLNNYVEVLTGTMTDAVIRNISLQASNKVAEETIAELSRIIEELNQNGAVLSKELEELKTSKTNFDNVKHQVDHLDTFRNELIKEREEHQKTRDSYEEKIKELNDKIDYLQLTPAKRKKIDEANKVSEAKTLIDITEDGGLF